MLPNKEVELKLRFFQEELWDTINLDPFIQKMALAGSEKEMFLETVYYDTPSNSLKDKGLSYRIRRQGDEWIATVKADGITSGGLHDRSEWSIVVENPEPDIAPFYKLPVGERLKDSLGQGILQEILRTRFNRKSIELQTKNDGLMELAVDCGDIVAGEKSVPIQEIELELRKGSVVEVLQVAAELAKRYVLLPEGESKFQRGLVLADLIPLEETKSTDNFKIRPDEEAAKALEKRFLFYVQEIISLQERSIRTACPKEILYQFSEKLQRLKALLTFSRTVINRERESGVLNCIADLEKDVCCRYAAGPEEQAEIMEDIIKGKYVAVMFEFWAWLLSSPWYKKEITIKEFAENWFGSWITKMQNINTSEKLGTSRAVQEFVYDIFEYGYILEEIQPLFVADNENVS